jgi:hypothetical protein
MNAKCQHRRTYTIWTNAGPCVREYLVCIDCNRTLSFRDGMLVGQRVFFGPTQPIREGAMSA